MRTFLCFCAACLCALIAQAQGPQKSVTLTVSRTINGVTTDYDTTFSINDPSEIEGVLESMGIDEPKENQTLEKRIVIRDVEEEGRTLTYDRPSPRPMLGVYLQDWEHMDRSERRRLGMEDGGVYISGMTSNSAAEDAGLRKGDVIVSIEGQTVNSADDIGRVKDGFEVGDNMRVNFLRKGNTESRTVRLRGRATNSNGHAMATTTKTKPFLGVVPHTVDDDIVDKYRLPGGAREGVFLSEIVKNSAAASAGLQAKDVIVRINGEEITDNDDLRYGIADAARENDGKMNIVVVRDGVRRTIKAVLGEKTTTSKVHVKVDEKEKVIVKKPFLGVYMATAGNGGVRITNTVRGKAAEEAGIQADDIIVDFDGESVANYNDLVYKLNNYKPGDKIRIGLLRDGDPRTVRLTLGEKTVTRYVMKEKIKTQEIDIDVMIREFSDRKVAEELLSDMENPTLEMPDFDVFPNPSDGRFTVRFTPSPGGPVNIKVYDIKGRILYQESLTDFRGTYDKRIDIADNPSGNYFLQITQNGQGMAKQLVIR